jgi:hypothetical protein
MKEMQYSYLFVKNCVKLLLKSYVLLMTTCFFVANTTAQTLIDSLPIPSCHSFSLDRYGNYYLATKDGAIFRYDSAHQKNLFYSPEKPATITLLEARNALQIFAFYRDFQEYTLLDRFLTPIKTNSFRDTPINMARLACPALDGQLWVIDESDFSLVKYNFELNIITVKVPLSLLLSEQEYDICFMTEYQNQLFVVDKNSGILVFDNLGNYKHTLRGKGITYCNFMNENICYLFENQIITKNIYTQQSIYTIPFTPNVQFIAPYPRQLLLIGKLLYVVKL